MSHHHRHREAFTGGTAAAEARAACSQTRGQGRPGASRPGTGTGQRPGLGVLAAVTVLATGRRRRSSLACCKPGMTGWARRKA